MKCQRTMGRERPSRESADQHPQKADGDECGFRSALLTASGGFGKQHVEKRGGYHLCVLSDRGSRALTSPIPGQLKSRPPYMRCADTSMTFCHKRRA